MLGDGQAWPPACLPHTPVRPLGGLPGKGLPVAHIYTAGLGCYSPARAPAQHAACCHGDWRVYPAGCPGNAAAGGVSWHGPHVYAGWGRGWLPTSAGLEPWKLGNGPGWRDLPRPHLSQGQVLAPCWSNACWALPSPQANESQNYFTQRKSPVPRPVFLCPRLSPGPAVAPVLQSAFPSHSAPGTVPSCGQATLTGPLLGLCPQGSSAPTQGEARAFLLAQTQLGPAQGPDLPAPRPSVGSRGPAWPAPRVQPPTLFLKAGPGLGCLMIFSWWSSATLKFHLHGQAGPGLVYWRLAGGLG